MPEGNPMRGSVLGLLLLASAGTCFAQDAAPRVDFTCPACDRPHIWGDVDYLLWWVRPGSAPPLVTTGPASDAFPGALDQPGTRVLFGGGNGLGYAPSSGVRLTLGTWLDPERRWGVLASG